MCEILLIIPARGNSKGIPRKNIRDLGGNPLVYYAINTGLNSRFDIDVYVSSDDSEILQISKTLGAKTHKRSEKLSGCEVTLDPVVYDAYLDIGSRTGKKYALVITLQPTSPILKSSTLDSAIQKMLDNDIDTMISAAKDAHLSWKKVDNKFVPNYTKRLNRQELDCVYRETGGFVITKSIFLTEQSRLGKNIDLFLLGDGEEIDIDDYVDWGICEYYLKKKKVVFVVKGNNRFGLGHIYNSLIIANDITNHHLVFLVEKDSRLGYEVIQSKNYEVYMQEDDNIVNDVLRLQPDVVINDRLNTSSDYMMALKDSGVRTVNFEDLGDGIEYADMVINAIYTSETFRENHYYGFSYYLLRDEFQLGRVVEKVSRKVSKVLIAFGGTDPNNLTLKVLNSIYSYCASNEIKIKVVLGLGYDNTEALSDFGLIDIYNNVSNISDFMSEADIIFSAMGRTVYEITSLGIPAILMAQNKRELSHTFGYSQNGFLNLGEGKSLECNVIREEFIKLSESYAIRSRMNKMMAQRDVRSGRSRVKKMIKAVIED